MSEERLPESPPRQARLHHVLAVTAVPTTAWAVQQLLAGEPLVDDFRVIIDTRFMEHLMDFHASVLVVAPQNWEEMSYWLPDLHKQFRGSLWLVLAELRIAGMFAFSLMADLCTIVDSSSSREELRDAFLALIDRVALVPPVALLSRFTYGLAIHQHGRPSVPLTPRELQCGCAVSLGLSNRQIAQALSLSEETIKKHVHQLLHKLHCPDRVALGLLIEQAFLPLSPSY